MDAPSPELMQMIQGGGGQSGQSEPSPPPGEQPGAPAASATSNAPVSSPMATPQPKQGDKQQALISVSLAMDLLEQSLPALGSETDEGRTVLATLSNLSKKFGASNRKTQELVPAELKSMMQSLPQAGGMSPEMKALMGGHGGAPSGMPGAGKPPMQPPMQ